MVIQDLPNDVSKGKAAFSQYQSVTGNIRVTFAKLSELKSCPAWSARHGVPGMWRPECISGISADDRLRQGHFGVAKQPLLHLAVVPVNILAELQIAVLIYP